MKRDVVFLAEEEQRYQIGAAPGGHLRGAMGSFEFHSSVFFFLRIFHGGYKLTRH